MRGFLSSAAVLIGGATLLGVSNAAQASHILQFDLTGTDPAFHQPWTQTSVLSPWLTLTHGLSLGAGLGARSGTNEMTFTAAGDYGGTDTTVQQALDNSWYGTFTIAPKAGHVLDLNGATVNVTYEHNIYWAPENIDLFSSVTGFSLVSNSLGEQGRGTFNGGSGDHSDWTDTYNFTLPTSGYDGLTAPVEFRYYVSDGRYGGHTSSFVSAGVGGTAEVPEPASLSLLGFGSLALMARRRRAAAL